MATNGLLGRHHRGRARHGARLLQVSEGREGEEAARRRSVELPERYLQPGQRAVHTIETNGKRLDEEWAAFFNEHEFLVGISIDGIMASFAGAGSRPLGDLGALRRRGRQARPQRPLHVRERSQVQALPWGVTLL